MRRREVRVVYIYELFAHILLLLLLIISSTPLPTPQFLFLFRGWGGLFTIRRRHMPAFAFHSTLYALNFRHVIPTLYFLLTLLPKETTSNLGYVGV